MRLQVTMFTLKKNLRDFGSNEKVRKNYANTNIKKLNLDNQSDLNQLYENNTQFFNISPIRENNPRSNKKVAIESPPNQFNQTAAAVREMLLSQ